MAKLTADDRATLSERKWELDNAIDGWRFKGVRSIIFDRMVAERDRINAALVSGQTINLADIIRPKCKLLAQDIADAIARLKESLDAADAFTLLYGDADEDGQELLATLAFPAGADPREGQSDTRKWLERAVRYGLIPQ